jgi:hypothetical protein
MALAAEREIASAMDRLTGKLTDPARPVPRESEQPLEAPAGHTAHHSGPGFECSAASTAGRVHEHRSGSAWLGCIGAPYAVDANHDAGALLAKFGPGREELLGQLGGEFALAWFDARRRMLVLATDRFASVPVYYSDGADQFVFGTDLAWVSQQFPSPPAPDPQALYDYLFFSVVPSSRSILTGIRKFLRRGCSSSVTGTPMCRTTGAPISAGMAAPLISRQTLSAPCLARSSVLHRFPTWDAS